MKARNGDTIATSSLLVSDRVANDEDGILSNLLLSWIGYNSQAFDFFFFFFSGAPDSLNVIGRIILT